MRTIHKRRKYVKVTIGAGKRYHALIGNAVSKRVFHTATAAELYADNVHDRYFRLMAAAKRAKAEGVAQ